MDFEVLKFVVQAGLTVGGAFLAASLAARRYRTERWWLRKVSSYSELVEALHRMKWPATEHRDAAIEQRSITAEESQKLWEEFKAARRNVWRIAEGSSFLISGKVLAAVECLERELDRAHTSDTWFEHLDEQVQAINRCLNEVKAIGKQELGVSEG